MYVLELINLITAHVIRSLNSQICASNLGVVILVGLVNPLMVLPLILLTIVFYKVQLIYLETARDVKRLEATSRFFFCVIIEHV